MDNTSTNNAHEVIEAWTRRMEANPLQANAFVARVAIDGGFERSRPLYQTLRDAAADDANADDLTSWLRRDLAAKLARHHGFSWDDVAGEATDIPFPG